jgi:hypothetical protein
VHALLNGMPGIKSKVLMLMEYQTQREPSHMFEGEQRNWETVGLQEL